ncbi:MAG: L-Ala-D/L-Glu epimerase [Gammaproteobacteria bacterium]|jgi:L-alanine-DL-glutamate epimerase-like enolase superfamily enzyme|nr:L-Ala-D/L-Glu epimerase [Gammaproteobacteria bacterium]
MSGVTLSVRVEKLKLAAPFRISGFVFEEQDVAVVELRDGWHLGRGEASGVYYLDDKIESIVAAIESRRTAIESGMDRLSLQRLLPPGGARNAIDCAMWELEASRRGVPVWELAGVGALRPLVTTFTLGADDPQTMAAGARKYSHARSLKLKLTGDLEMDIARIRAVRGARPDVWIGVDANQGYTIGALSVLLDELVRAEVALLEQPLARGHEADLQGFTSPIPIAADESAQTLADLPGLIGRFQIVNIKLDKCGGLTEGLAMARRAREIGLGVMVGNMVGSSLAMAPGFILGQLCDVVDLDGPIFLSRDCTPGAVYAEGKIQCGEEVWGSGRSLTAAHLPTP